MLRGGAPAPGACARHSAWTCVPCTTSSPWQKYAGGWKVCRWRWSWPPHSSRSSGPEVARRLDDRVRLLDLGSRTAPPRQRTLRATLDWSYDLLSEPERLLCARLSVFTGGWALAAAESVCTGGVVRPEMVLTLLARLVDRSLVQTEPTPAGAMRYRFLETLRLYTWERLAKHPADEVAAVQLRHARYFQDLVEGGPAMSTEQTQADWLDALDAVRHDLRAALRWLIQSGYLGDARRLGCAGVVLA